MCIAIAKRPLAEPYCGDQAGYWTHHDKLVLCMVDGLGHGKHAEQAARAALSFVGRHYCDPLLEVFTCCDLALRDTRGAAMGIAAIESARGMLTYAGIGNTRAMIVGRRTTRLRSHYGIVGGGYRHLQTEAATLAPDDLVVLYTDGLEELIELSGYGETLRADVTGLAEKLIEDWHRAPDDAAVLVFRNSTDAAT